MSATKALIGSERETGRPGGHGWDTDIEMRVLLALESARDALGEQDGAPAIALGGAPPPPGQAEAVVGELLDHTIEAASTRLRAPGTMPRDRVATLAGALVELLELRDGLRNSRVSARLATLVRVQETVSRLRGVASVAELLERVCAEVCRCCGFDRALIFRVHGSALICEGAHFSGDPEWARAVLRQARAEQPRLVHSLLETEMLRRRAPALVLDPVADPRTYKPLIEATRTSCYVAAPIMPEDRVIGFLHADCYDSGRTLDTLDRDTLHTFAQGFGRALERVVLLDRLRSQRDHVRRMVASAEAVMNELAVSSIELGPTDQDDLALANAATLFMAPDAPILPGAPGGRRSAEALDKLLTRREREVLRLMAEGASNTRIAERLVISDGTVKSHVKHILRKLGAANRAEAVSRYLRLVNGAG